MFSHQTRCKEPATGSKSQTTEAEGAGRIRARTGSQAKRPPQTRPSSSVQRANEKAEVRNRVGIRSGKAGSAIGAVGVDGKGHCVGDCAIAEVEAIARRLCRTRCWNDVGDRAGLEVGESCGRRTSIGPHSSRTGHGDDAADGQCPAPNVFEYRRSSSTRSRGGADGR